VHEGLQVLAEEEPDVVVCDIAMPEQDGYEFLRAVRARESPANATPVIALTAYARPQDRVRALNAGFDEYLKKPLEPIELVETVRRVTTRHR
jgi:CheY-like chemotaxis protein